MTFAADWALNNNYLSVHPWFDFFFFHEHTFRICFQVAYLLCLFSGASLCFKLTLEAALLYLLSGAARILAVHTGGKRNHVVLSRSCLWLYSLIHIRVPIRHLLFKF